MHARSQEIVATARTYLGTPFHHQGRLRGTGIDCVGLLVGVATELGLTQRDNQTYGRQPDGRTLLAELRAELDEISLRVRAPGDVLVFWMLRRQRWPQHIGFATDVGLLHTYQHVGRVVEHGLDARWLRRLCHAFRFRS